MGKLSVALKIQWHPRWGSWKHRVRAGVWVQAITGAAPGTWLGGSFVGLSPQSTGPNSHSRWIMSELSCRTTSQRPLEKAVSQRRAGFMLPRCYHRDSETQFTGLPDFQSESSTMYLSFLSHRKAVKMIVHYGIINFWYTCIMRTFDGWQILLLTVKKTSHDRKINVSLMNKWKLSRTLYYFQDILGLI